MADTGPAKLPGLPKVTSGDPAISRWIQAVSERLEVREGARGNPAEAVVLQRDLDALKLANTTINYLAETKTNIPPGSVELPIGPGISAVVAVDAFAEALRNSALYKHLMTQLDDPHRFDNLPDVVRQVLLKDLAQTAAALGADISRLEYKVQGELESLAMTVDQVTASVAGAAAGVRDVTFASATANQAQAGKITQIVATLDPYVGMDDQGNIIPSLSSKIETTMLATVSRGAGAEALYSVKMEAGRSSAGFGMYCADAFPGNSATPNGTDSTFMVAANRFAIVPSSALNSLATAQGLITNCPFGVETIDGVNNSIYINGTVYIKGRILGGAASAFGTGTGLWAGYDKSNTTYQFRVGSNESFMAWDGSKLYVVGNMFIGGPNSGVTLATIATNAAAPGIKTVTSSIFKWSLTDETNTFSTGWSAAIDWDNNVAYFDGTSPLHTEWSSSAPAATANLQRLYEKRLTVTELAIKTGIGRYSWASAKTFIVGYRNDGAAGGTGATGPRGSRTLYFNYEWISRDTDFVYYAQEWFDQNGLLPLVKGDTAVFTNAVDYTYTLTYDGVNWVPPGTIIDGDLLVDGSITATKLNVNAINASTGNINTAHIQTLMIGNNQVTVPMSCSGGNKQVFTSTGTKADYPPFTDTQVTLRVFGSYVDPILATSFTYLDAGFLTALLIMQCSTEAERVTLAGVGIGSSVGCRARGRARLVRFIDTATVPFVTGMVNHNLVAVPIGTFVPINTVLNVGTIFDTWVSVGSDYMNQFSAAGSIAIQSAGYYGVTFDLGNNWNTGNWQLPVNAEAIILGSRR